ncbi:MAG: hypothetical protein ACJAR9_001347 [Celeribacter sp.]|jgi:hypothetical protein
MFCKRPAILAGFFVALSEFHIKFTLIFTQKGADILWPAP